ncbi:unnamed protein product [Porites evermanni]|uniref:DNA-directed DNA polymerase n=1 Tax=Porites evermanni TaxID=104178 RepID=A0ABN8SMP8_9CNID|nr:unnamed protein product [Porites evermanni]
MLATLAGKLNSNEAFNPDRGFQVDVVFVSMPGPGSGRHKQRNVGRLCLDRDNKKKKCIIPIKNRDALCCARAIVTMRAHCHKDQGVDGFRDWDNLKRGRPVQLRQAQALHQQAGVAEGPCGLPELRQFQQALGPQYQLLVMTRMKPFFLIFKGPDAPHPIRLLKSNDHFDGCTSFPAFVNRSYYCLDCERGFNTNDRTSHTCQGRRCQWVSIQDHKCYIQPVVENEEIEPTEEGGGSMVAPPPPLFVYADFEAMQNAEGVFVANLLCYSSSEEATIHVLDGEDCALQFLRDLDDLTEVPDSESERNILVVFHNLKGLTASVKFIDSLCFLPMPLASFPSTFNLTELKKGFFPHLFNTPDHQQYVGRIPDLEFYDPEGMMAKKKDELTRWHADQVRRNVRFDFRQEMIDYCKSDVALLKAGCEAFQQEFERQAGFNPMAKCITIASACNLYWRRHHLTPDTIAVEPLGGWRGAQVNQSLKALQWLYYQEHQIPKEGASADRIRHVRNGGEQSVRTIANSYFVDGYDPLTRTVYEFHGCLYHGCPRCYPSRDAKHYAVPDRTVEELYQATLSKRMALLRAGYTVIEMWECDWDRLVDNEPAVSQFQASFDLVAPLEPREAFFGGRTGAVALHTVAGEGEEIRYVDVTSLYPWVNKNCPYPIGHPKIITQPADQSLGSYFGLATVDILPPAGLFHPVLPVRCGQKLTFPLCRACVQTEQAQPMLTRTHYCPHSDADRTLRGTWCTPELVKAGEKGYTLVKIHEVWHFPPEQRRTGLFATYVNTWLKLKQESAGWPGWCQTLEQKREYILRYQEREGIRLDIASIAKNPGRKATAKLMLNSFWGKFGERMNKPTTVTVKDPAHLFNLISDAALDLSTLRLCTDDILEAVYTSVQDNAVKGTKTNIFVAAFTTCHARLKLYESLDILQQQVLYYDTDSVIYRWRPGQPSITTGDFLGDMTDELDGDVITEFVSGGAKNYGYTTRAGKVVCKVRGFTLNVRGSAILNFHTMKDNILSELDSPQDSRRHLNIVTPYHFTRDLEKKQI